MEQPTTKARRGQAGGKATAAKYGVDYMRTLGCKGGRTTSQRHGRAHMQQLGRKGFAVMVERHFGGDRERAINTLIHRGLMAQDPCWWNGAWTRDDVPHRYTNPAKRHNEEEP
jgi:hypothetical protein